jgi:hypothetical protein
VNLNYDKIKSKIEHGGNPWTSYSDLFLVLSVIFLLLYVVANLRASTASLINAREYQKAMKENEVMKKQITAYEVLKDDYVKQGPSDAEMQAYQQLIRRLDLLGDETKSERERLETQARELNEKEKALNQYQMMMKSIINANMISQARMKTRDQKIEERDRTIVEKERNINDLSQTLAQKQQEVAQREQVILHNNDQISQIQTQLQNSIQEARNAYQAKKATQESMQKEIARLKKESFQQIAALQQVNEDSEKQLKKARESIEAKNRELENTIATLNEREQKHRESLQKAKDEHAAKLAKMAEQRKAFEKELEATKMGAEEKLRRQRDYAKQLEQEKKKYDTQLKQAQNNLEDTQKNIRDLASQYQNSMQTLAKANDDLKRNLNESQAKRNQRRLLAKRISDKLKKAGVPSQVDPETGEVTIHFVEEYFDYGKAELKPDMKAKLEKIFPIYAAALFEDQNVGGKIATVDIVGFASPTFRGKFVDPDSLATTDRAAVNFNMDLSYQRAKAIFGHVFDTRHMQYAHQKDLLPIVRVTGRSYLSERKPNNGRSPASTSKDDYCQTYDCQKSQKVLIKFNLKEEE